MHIRGTWWGRRSFLGVAMGLAFGTGCTDPGCEDQPPGPAVSFVVANPSEGPLFIEGVGCSAEHHYRLTGPGGAEVNPNAPNCSTCAETDDLTFCATPLCAAPPLFVLAPGAHHAFRWEGTETRLVRGCTVGTCPRRVTPARGSYELSMVAFRAADCGGASCDCAEESCWVDGTGSDAIEASIRFDYPAQGDVVLVFE